jgi:hypothetical protein
MNRLIFLIIFLLLTGNLYPQNSPEKKIYNTKFTGTPPSIDGSDNEECWNEVDWGSDFIQMDPEENRPPSQQTSFKILYDDNNLYVFVRAFDSEPEKISRIITRRDNFIGDRVTVVIDSYFDKQTAFAFTAMASGAKGDETVTMNGNYWDDSWNPVWYLKTSKDEKGWCAELRIPLNQLRFGNKQEQVWGIQVSRQLYRLEERSAWQFIPKGSPGTIHLFGELHGIRNIKPRKHLELLPYAVAKTERFEKEEGNPFMDGKSTDFSGGLDGKIGITNDLTVDFTINPDFGQVEADPSEVNITAFETYFSEQRPFFVEGKNIYEFEPNNTITISKLAGDNLFYSRRIGRYPHYYPQVSPGEYVEMPDATTILGSAKLSGKTRKGLAIGILESLTSNEKAVIDNSGLRRKEGVEPLTNYFVGRLKKDFNKGETVLGGIITAVNREINDPALFFLPSSAYTGGIDFQHNWKERTYYVAGNMEFSNILGRESAITALQRSSARYYQRPDAGHLEVDSSLTSLSGLGGTVKFGRGSNKKIQFETSLTLRSPGLEFNDIGYMRYSDVIHHATWVAYYIRNPFAIFNNFYLNTNYWLYWDFSGRLLSANANMNFNTQFRNKWRLNGSFTRQGEHISTSMLRGGPSFTVPGELSINMNINSNQSKKIIFNTGFYKGLGDERNYRTSEYWGTLRFLPFNSLSASISPDYSINRTDLQYVSTINLAGEEKYLFGRLNMKTLALIVRLNYTVNPELSIEYYGQPFVSAGRYNEFKKITNANGSGFSNRYHIFAEDEIRFDEVGNSYVVDENGDGTVDYSIPDPNFNFREFRSNLVIRWEYHPGSTLYLVWSQGRTSSGYDGLFSYGNDMKNLFDIVPHNVLLVKLSYWFSP